jgi:hypothetical protein
MSLGYLELEVVQAILSQIRGHALNLIVQDVNDRVADRCCRVLCLDPFPPATARSTIECTRSSHATCHAEPS